MGQSESIPKSWYQLKRTDRYNLVDCYYKYYYCRSKKRIIRVPRGFERTVTMKPILVDGQYVYEISPCCTWSSYIDRDKLINILKTDLKGESLPVYLDDFDDVDLEKYIE